MKETTQAETDDRLQRAEYMRLRLTIGSAETVISFYQTDPPSACNPAEASHVLCLRCAANLLEFDQESDWIETGPATNDERCCYCSRCSHEVLGERSAMIDKLSEALAGRELYHMINLLSPILRVRQEPESGEDLYVLRLVRWLGGTPIIRFIEPLAVRYALYQKLSLHTIRSLIGIHQDALHYLEINPDLRLCPSCGAHPETPRGDCLDEEGCYREKTAQAADPPPAA